MAEEIPRFSTVRLPSKERALRKAMRLLRGLPDDFTVRLSSAICQGISETERSGPDFLVLWRERFAALIHVQSTRKQAVDQVLGQDMFTKLKPEDFGCEAREVLESFSLPEEFPVEELSKLKRLILFTDLESGDVGRVLSVAKMADSGVSYVAQDELEADLFERLCDDEDELLPGSIAVIRSCFDPQTVVRRPSMRVGREAREARFTPDLLDHRQEAFVKSHLVLSEDAEAAVELLDPSTDVKDDKDRCQAWLVRGISGSGKSIILIHRAAMLAQANPRARVILLSHNRALVRDLQLRLGALGVDAARQVNCRNFFSWAGHCLPKRGPQIQQWKLNQVLNEYLALEGADLPRKAFKAELEFMKDFGLVKRAYYVEQATGRRRKRLTEGEANRIYDHMLAYQKMLKKRDLVGWSEVALRFRKAALAGELADRRYDAILIDEAQFYAKVWFDVVRALLKPGGQLILAADHTQGFLRDGVSWVAAGIEVRGRTVVLDQAYRNSREILAFAKAFYEDGDFLDEVPDLEENLPDETSLEACREVGVPPFLAQARPGDGVLRAVNEVEALFEGGFPHGALLVLAPSWDIKKGFIQALKAKNPDISTCEAENRESLDGGAFVYTCTIEAATGIEASHVIILNPERIFESQDSPDLTPEDRRLQIKQNKRRFYMACTRAAHKLLIITESGKLHEKMKGLLPEASRED